MNRLMLLLLASLLALGCGGPPPRRARRGAAKPDQAATAAADLERGRDMLFKLFQFDSAEGSLRCAPYFNQWLAGQNRGDWKPDPLIQKLPATLRQSSILRDLDETNLSTDDVEYMETMVWMKDLVGWVAQQDAPAPLAEWISQQPSLGADAARLELAVKLFDWSVRNLQLLPFQQVEREGRQQMIMPGANRIPRMALLLGVGDPWERARIFIQLCRQAEIDAVMLATPPAPPDTAAATKADAPATDAARDPRANEPAPWLPAVLLAGELYLFDSGLGLPVPAQDDQGIATLKLAREDPEVLRALSLGDTMPYSVQSDDLDEVLALVDAAPEALSLKMHLLESRLTGQYRLTLTVRPSELKKKLAPMGLKTELWTVPIDAVRYERMVQIAIRRDPNAAAQYQRGQALFVGTAPLIMGRKLHLHGEFAKSEDNEGAKQRYMAVRIPDQHIRDLTTSLAVQRGLGIQRGTYEREDEWQMRLRGIQGLSREAKMHASYWIGLVHYEEGRFDSAKQWLGKRVLQEMPDSIWTAGARYNLARTYEQLGEFDKARELYLEDDSPQKHGSLLRARRLKTANDR